MKKITLWIRLSLGTALLAACGIGPLTIDPSPVPVQSAAPATLSGPFAAPPATNTPASPSSTPSPTPTPLPPVPTATPVPPVRFAVIGDYGLAGEAEAGVAALVKSWSPDFIITTGDNNYPSGAAETIDENVGQYYAEFIAPYTGQYGPGAAENRFFPTLGNHDWDTPGAQPYFDYFTLPGNERYYDFVRGPVHLFALDADSREPDGVSSQSIQAAWLQDRLASATEPWKIVYFHQAPYSSGTHGPVEWMQWPFKEWGATLVLSGHDHTYERLEVDGFPYFVNGLGGGPIYDFLNLQEASRVRYNADHGALLVEASQGALTFQFINLRGEIIDSYALNAGVSAVVPSQAPAPAAALDHTLALLPPSQADLAALPMLTRYTLTLSLNYTQNTFTGHARVDYVNIETVPLDRLYFRLFPNGGLSYGDGALRVAAVSVDGLPAATELSLSDSVLAVPLPQPLEPAGQVQVGLDFAGSIPQEFGDGQGYGIYNASDGVLALANWYPILAVYDQDGWNLDPVNAIGDSVYSDMALYTVEVTAPQDLVLAATGVQTDRQAQGGAAHYRFVSGPARDFFLIASPDFQRTSQVVDGVQLNTYFLPGHEAGNAMALSVAAGSLEYFNERFGPYPYAELDVVDGPMNGAGGVEYPGIVMIASDNYDEPTESDLGITVAHEVAHQWWYNLVGNDVIDAPWLDEALATYSSGLYYENARGAGFFDGFLAFLENSYEQLREQGGDDQVTRSLGYFESHGLAQYYGRVVYIKGALFFQQVRQAIGDAAFFAALREYAQREKYGVAQAEDLLSAFESVSGRSLEELYREWLYSP